MAKYEIYYRWSADWDINEIIDKYIGGSSTITNARAKAYRIVANNPRKHIEIYRERTLDYVGEVSKVRGVISWYDGATRKTTPLLASGNVSQKKVKKSAPFGL